MTTSKASKGVNEVTTTNEHSPAGDREAVQDIMHEVFKYADVAAPLRGPPMTQDESLPVMRAALAQKKIIRDKLYALAASHRERSERDVSNGANCAQGEAEPYAYLSALDGQYADERTSTNFRALLECHRRGKPHWPKGALLLYTAPPSQPADKPAGQAVTDAEFSDERELCSRMRLFEFDDRRHPARAMLLEAAEVIERLCGEVRDSWAEVTEARSERDDAAAELAALAPEPATAGAIVDDEMVERACKRYAFREDGALFPDAYGEDEVRAERVLMREFLTHVIGRATPAAAVPDGLIAALRSQRQIDEHGDQVGVNRQAVDEAATILESLAAAPANRPADNSQPSAAREAQRGVPARLRLVGQRRRRSCGS